MKNSIPHFRRPSSADAGRSAFSLVEMMVVITVLTVLGILIAQIIKATTDTTRLSNRNVDASSQARMAFDRIALDMASLVQRPDVDFRATNSPTSSAPDSLKFLSSVTSSGLAASNNRGMSLVAYKVAVHADNPRRSLLRAGKPVAWNQTGFAGLRSTGLPVLFTDLSFPLTFVAADYDILVPGVIRMVLGFQLYPDDEDVTLIGGGGPLPEKALGQIVYAPPIKKLTASDGVTTVDVVDLPRISSLIVGLVALNPESLKPLNETQTGALASAFAVPASGTLMAIWNPLTENVESLPSTVPLPARQAVKVFQRSFPIHAFGNQGL